MFYSIAADIIVVLHFTFILFVIFGGLLVLKWRKLMYIHIPIVLWGVLIEFVGWVCPLTPVENILRRAAGQQGYDGGFIEHYLLPIIYPANLTHDIQIVLGTIVIVINVVIYSWIIYLNRRAKK